MADYLTRGIRRRRTAKTPLTASFAVRQNEGGRNNVKSFKKSSNRPANLGRLQTPYWLSRSINAACKRTLSSEKQYLNDATKFRAAAIIGAACRCADTFFIWSHLPLPAPVLFRSQYTCVRLQLSSLCLLCPPVPFMWSDRRRALLAECFQSPLHTHSLLDYCFLRTCNNIFCSRRTTAKHRFHKFANAHLCGRSPPLCPEPTVMIAMHRHYNLRTALFSAYLSP